MRSLLMGGSLLLMVGWLYSQEEGRHREVTPTSKSASVPPRPAPRREEVIMEMASGQIVDKSEKGLPNARIWIVDKSTGKVLGETRSDANGNYALAVPRVDSVIVRISVDGKAFMEREYRMESFLTLSDLTFEP